MLKKLFVPSSFEIVVGARGSLLSRKQVEEVHAEIKSIHPHIRFRPLYVATRGDKDKETSLREMDQTDFFTREIDHMLLRKECRIAIHSAKDLPAPLPDGLVLAALTQGVDPSDALVYREYADLSNGTVATSSKRREENVKKLFPHAQFVDIRGTIEERIGTLNQKEVDGVVIAEAALIRLGWTHLSRIKIPGETAPLQGKLAIVTRQDDQEMLTLFSKIDII